MPGYLGNDPAGSATKIARQTYTTSGAATTDFTFTSGYDVGYLDVYVNGERQTKGKNFTASDGSTFKVLNGGVGTGSTVEAIAYKTFNLATVDFDDLGNTGNLTLTGDITGANATFTGDVSIGGTLTYEDVTSIDSVGVITARLGVDILSGGIDIVGNTTGLNVTGVSTFAGPISVGDTISLGDHDRLRFGAGNDLQIYHDGTDNYVQDSRDNGRLRISADILQVIDKDASEQMLKATVDGAVELSYNGSTKFETTGAGVTVTGITTSGGFVLDENDGIHFRTTAADDLDSILRESSSNTLLVNSRNDIIINIDSNNDSSDAHFAVGHGAATGSSTELFKVQESGDVTQNSGTFTVKAASGDSSGLKLSQESGDESRIFNHFSGPLTFGTGNTERLRIDSSGNVGIGTTIADRALHVLSTNGTVAHFESNNANEIAQVVFEGLGASAPPNLGATGEDLHFTTNNLERVRITSAGDVGIGTTIPRNVSNFGSFAINGTSGAFADYVLNGTRTGTVAVDSNGFTCEAVGSSTPFRVITNGSERVRVDITGNVNITGITTASQLFEGTSRVATAGKAVAMALVFG